MTATTFNHEYHHSKELDENEMVTQVQSIDIAKVRMARVRDKDSEYVTRHLHRRYPIALRNVVIKFMPWLLAVGLVSTVIGLINVVDPQATIRILPPLNLGGALFILAALLILGVTLVHLVLYQNSLKYWIEDDSFVLEKGVAFRALGSFPLHTISDVYVGCSFPSALVGLYYIEIRTPSQHESEEFARIDGLTRKNALGIKSAIAGALPGIKSPHIEKMTHRQFARQH